MQKFFRRLVLSFLAWCARSRLQRYPLQIVGVTGSVGKTTTKEAVALILSSAFAVHANPKSFNSEFGLPLTILNEDAPVSVLGWFGVCWRAWNKRVVQPTFTHLVVELGADAPGDMDYLLSIVQPQVGIFLSVAPVHLADGQFANLEEIAAEKGKLISTLPTTGTAILNRADPLVWKFATAVPHCLSFGSAEADLSATDLQTDLQGLRFQLYYGDTVLPVTVPILGEHHVPLLLAALATGLSFGLPLEQCVDALSHFRLPPGRLNIIPGLNGSTLIDATYNSNPASARAALRTLAQLPGRRIAVLGQMNELGVNSADYHHRLGAELPPEVDHLFTVFGDAHYISDASPLPPERRQHFPDHVALSEFLQTFLQPGDIVLFKGSQNGVRLEKAVRQLMVQPELAPTLLCRQGKNWQK